MSAENLLLLLDEADEFNVLLKEALTPGALAALLLLAIALTVGWQTGSMVLAVAALIATAWGTLVAAWLVQSPATVSVSNAVKTRSR